MNISILFVALFALTCVGQEPKRDRAATRYMNTCAGCHSLTGLRLNGPELSPTAAWPMTQLQTAIKRMEKNVGPLPDEDVTMLAELLKAPDVRERLKLEEARIQAQFAAKLEPPNATLGRQLFFGSEPFKNGGMACVACHVAAGQGGNLGPDLTGVFAKMGETPLVSAIEKTSFKIMAPHYRWHPVTRQEALHLSKYLSTLNPQVGPAATPTFLPVGAGGALAAFIGLALYFRGGRKGRDTKLQRRVK
ncbi:MAG: c-type cytochrome [Verrucomicrobiota bacterium]